MSESAPCTRAVRAGIESDTQHGAVVPPLHLSSNYSFEGLGGKRAYDYSRSGNPTRDLLGNALAELEQGAGAVVTSSGMSAVALALELVPAGSKILAAHDCYGGTYRLFAAVLARWGLDYVPVHLSDLAAVRRCLADQPARIVWVETPTNPLLGIADIAALAEVAHAAGALLVVDNTFASPRLQRPLVLGADVVVHSTTKYINGHSDVVGGAVIAREAAVFEQLKWWANCNGLTGAPFDSYLTLRGLRTLSVRLRQHQENAERIASRLDGHPAVRKVYYPGLASHAGHALASRQQQGFGAMLSFELDGEVEQIAAFVDGLRYFSLAESLGGVESLIAHPATMTHSSMAAEARRTAGIADSLLRLSVGIEDGDDLLRDLDAALLRAAVSADNDKSKRRVLA